MNYQRAKKINTQYLRAKFKHLRVRVRLKLTRVRTIFTRGARNNVTSTSLWLHVTSALLKLHVTSSHLIIHYLNLARVT